MYKYLILYSKTNTHHGRYTHTHLDVLDESSWQMWYETRLFTLNRTWTFFSSPAGGAINPGPLSYCGSQTLWWFWLVILGLLQVRFLFKINSESSNSQLSLSGHQNTGQSWNGLKKKYKAAAILNHNDFFHKYILRGTKYIRIIWIFSSSSIDGCSKCRKLDTVLPPTGSGYNSTVLM